MPTIECVMRMLADGELTDEDVWSNGWLCSVTQRIDRIRQPRGGYIPAGEFDRIHLDGGGINELNPQENVSPGLVGTTVDYLTRFMEGSPARRAFRISGMGAACMHRSDLFEMLVSRVVGLDDESIDAAVKLSGFDSAFRAGAAAYRPVECICPDRDTKENIRAMVGRSLRFFERYGPVIADGLTFEGGYTGYVAAGDGDFLTEDTLWDFKVSRTGPRPGHTLQLLMYWRMGLRSIHPEYGGVRHLGIYNPRLNIVYRLDVRRISPDVIAEVEATVIGYDDPGACVVPAAGA